VDQDFSALPPADIQVIVKPLRNTEGQLRLSLYGSKKGFPKDPEHALRVVAVPILDEIVEVRLDSIPAGRYAVSVFHDGDDDAKMATDWLGRPREGWGVSNDARRTFGAPYYDDAAFVLAGKDVTVEITIEYP
jgi:uncharacterized protein (DUF2141 family)